MTELQEFILAALKAQGFVGMVAEDRECSCDTDDFAPCGDGPFMEACCPSKADSVCATEHTQN